MSKAAMKLESFSAKVTLQHKELVKKQDKALAQNEEIKEGIEDIQEGLEDIQFNLTEGFEGQNAFLNVILREVRHSIMPFRLPLITVCSHPYSRFIESKGNSTGQGVTNLQIILKRVRN
jgi:hypothetical protein